MSATYTGWHARWYNRIWRRFEERTLESAIALIDWSTLASGRAHGQPPLRILDVACGTGLLLQHLSHWLPGAEFYGVDASADMLVQAHAALGSHRNMHLVQATLGAEPWVDLPLSPNAFDLVTCTNAMHYFPDPTAILAGLGQLLATTGQLVLVDYARRPAPFPWPLFESLVRRVDPNHVRAYTVAEARELCRCARLRVIAERTFAVDWLWHGWGLRVYATAPIASPPAAHSTTHDVGNIVTNTFGPSGTEHLV